MLVERMRDPSAEVREEAARGLGRLGASEGAEVLRGALDDRIPSVRAAAAASLGVIRDRAAVGPLLEQAQHDDFVPAQAAAHAFVGIDPKRARDVASLETASPHLREAVDLDEALG
jgi:HEAT repeat protein